MKVFILCLSALVASVNGQPQASDSEWEIIGYRRTHDKYLATKYEVEHFRAGRGRPTRLGNGFILTEDFDWWGGKWSRPLCEFIAQRDHFRALDKAWIKDVLPTFEGRPTPPWHPVDPTMRLAEIRTEGRATRALLIPTTLVLKLNDKVRVSCYDSLIDFLDSPSPLKVAEGAHPAEAHRANYRDWPVLRGFEAPPVPDTRPRAPAAPAAATASGAAAGSSREVPPPAHARTGKRPLTEDSTADPSGPKRFQPDHGATTDQAEPNLHLSLAPPQPEPNLRLTLAPPQAEPKVR